MDARSREQCEEPWKEDGKTTERDKGKMPRRLQALGLDMPFHNDFYRL